MNLNFMAKDVHVEIIGIFPRQASKERFLVHKDFDPLLRFVGDVDTCHFNSSMDKI